MNYEENRKKVSEAVKQSYIKNPMLLELRSKDFTRIRNSDAFIEHMYKIGIWKRPEDKDKWTRYYETVRQLTQESYTRHFYKIENAKKRSRDFHLDHKVSIMYGYMNDIPEVIISHYKNLEILPHSINESKGQKNSLLFEDLLYQISTSKEPINKKILLQCGGAAGHLSHPFEDMDLTFDDMSQMITLGLQGGFSTKELQEKLDGQNIMVSWINGELKGARNKSHIKDFGANALNTSQVSEMFAGRGNIHDAFTFAMEDLSSAIGKLGEKDKKKIFGNGKKFANLEVLYPATQNVIPYGVSMLKFHNITEYDREGNPINTDAAGASKLAAMIAKVNANVQRTFTIAGPSNITLQKSQDFSKKQPMFLAKLNQLKSKFHLSGSDPVMKYHEEWWRSFVEKKARLMKYAISEQVLGKLVNRWAFGDKSYSVADIKKEIDSEPFKAWVLDYDKNNVALQLQQNIEPFERLFLQVGAEVLSNASGLLASNPDAAVQKLKADLDIAANDIKSSGDINKLIKLKQQLQRLKAVGGVNKIAPTEGIVFNYKGKLYKFTGAFAPIGQIMGVMKFDR